MEKKTGRELWTAEWAISRFSNESVFKCTLKGEGIFGKSAERMSWVTETVVDLTAGIRTQYSNRKNYGREGSLLGEHSKRYDFPSGTVTFERKSAVTGEAESRVYDFSGDVLGDEFLANLLRGLPFQAKSKTEFHMLTSEPRLYRATVKFHGTEDVTVPAGTFTCFKTELVPELGILGALLKRFIPKTYLWHSVSEPHIWVQYEGLESGLKTPHVLMQLTHFETPGTAAGDGSQ